ncbi:MULTISPECIES: hemin ABC transporter substrate-binding protein [unclassified Meiothermus]|uniref:heme/hemin ABC transporter substrate-binding protein n=1 Tax=unclassified Meiothermus TaxID=370471 RepID=UPI000D7BBB9A|nr:MULTISPECIES: hemin ABC transporter substrate-binding protein [unclassified Meiothermus]PZA06356.1 hemin ABC transporter substrate-binding protein [Meiothermus sp. Pnk-1]RYM35229.1 hemin ABC transporter substrate-binding protein [Meiothermus sp. PNK-Is4]
MKRLLWAASVALGLGLAQPFTVKDARGQTVTVRSIERIVSLNGVTTEILFALGVGDRVVGRDTSSYYPAAANKLPTVGYQFQLNAEGILALKPTLVLGREDAKPPQVFDQLAAAGVTVVRVPDKPTLEGAKEKIRTIAAAVGQVERGEALVRALERDLLVLRSKQRQATVKKTLKGLFLYLRGTQVTYVCGEGSNPVGMMELAGIANAAKGIKDCQQMTAEAVVAAQPDLIVVFTKGLESIGGLEGLRKLPGVMQTPAGQAGRVVAIDDLYLGGFGPRAGRAALELFIGAYERQGLYIAGEPAQP